MLLNRKISIFTFIKEIKYDIMAIVTYAVVVGIVDQYSFLSKISIPTSITAIIATALSLLLAFRTAQAYERWWEARIVWGAIVNDSRTLIRQLMQFHPQNSAYAPTIETFVHRQIIWCYALGESLRRLPFSNQVQHYINEHNITDKNIPNAILNLHSAALSQLDVSEFKQVQIDHTLMRLCDAMGKCERIKNTVFPKSYSLFIHLLIYVFATLLPFGLDDKYIIEEIFLTTLLPLIFITIERTAILLQDPFENSPSDTPMTNLATTIEINLKEMIHHKDVPIIEKTTSFYLM